MTSEVVNFPANISQSTIIIALSLPPSLLEDRQGSTQSMCIAASIDQSIASCVKQIILTFEERRGFPIEDDPELYTLKVTGRCDYFLDPDAPLRRYRYVTDCIRNGKLRINLSLFRLPYEDEEEEEEEGEEGEGGGDEKGYDDEEEDANGGDEEEGEEVAVTPVAGKYIRENEKDEESEEEFDMDRTLNDDDDTFMGFVTTPQPPSMPHDHPRFKQWPYRLKIMSLITSLQGTDQNMLCGRNFHSLSLVYIRIEVVYGGDVVKCMYTAPMKVCSGKGVSWNHNWISFGKPALAVGAIPLGARLCFTVFGRLQDNDQRKTGIETVENEEREQLHHRGMKRHVHHAAKHEPWTQKIKRYWTKRRRNTVERREMEQHMLRMQEREDDRFLTGSWVVESDDIILGGVSMQIFDHNYMLIQGKQQLRLLPGQRAEKRTVCLENAAKDAPLLLFTTAQFPQPIVYRLPDHHNMAIGASHTGGSSIPKLVRQDMEEHVMRIVKRDLLGTLNFDDKTMIWNQRAFLRTKPETLPRFLQSVDWFNESAVTEAHRYLSIWKKPSPEYAMILLNVHYPDYRVRQYAVRRLEDFDDEDLSEFLLQLCQLLKFEPYHRSPLALFLVRRALANPAQVGHKLFWHLRSEMHEPSVCVRFGVILRAYLAQSGSHISVLSRQHDVQSMLKKAADEVVEVKRKHSARLR